MSRTLSRSSIDICADCSALDPSWVSINRGVLVCDGCCSVHLSLGRHVSQIKSLKKGSWSPQQLTMVHQLVNCGANNIWEYSLLDPSQNRQGRRKPNPRDPVYPVKADFIRAKYQFLAFVNKHKDAEVTLEDINKQLHASVRTSNLETSLRLLSAGADPNYVHPEKGNGALHIATQANQSSQVELLLVYGADPGSFDAHGRTPADIARLDGHVDLSERLIECQYELTDGLAYYLCSRRPDHRAGQHFIIPEVADSSLDLSELAKAAKKKLQALSNHLFEELAMDVYDEVDRRENETIWLSTQNHGSMLISDRQTVPFLPANPEYSATRNQGRQKLAKFNKREFATLIIDILNDAKRRYGTGTASPTNNLTGQQREKRNGEQDVKLLRNARKAVGAGGSMSDDEPLYDSVCSDEDYASIGDSQSVKEESNASKTQVSSSKETIDTMKMATLEAKPHAGGMPITVDEYSDLKQTLKESEMRMQQLLHSNTRLGEEVALLQNMVKKLVHENRLLRCGYSPVDIPPSVNGHEVPKNDGVGCGRPARWSLVESSDSRRHITKTDGTLRDFPSPPEELLAAKSPVDCGTTASGENSNSSTMRSRVPPTHSTDIGPTDTMLSPSSDFSAVAESGADNATSSSSSDALPTQDDVVKKTDRITKRLQELFLAAQEGNRTCFSASAENIHLAVVEMVSLFPQSAMSSKMSDTLQLLVAGAEHLRDQCSVATDSAAGSQESRMHTQQVIQSAYDIAKAAKQLVMLFE